MKKGKVKNSSKLNIKKISFGTALATGAIVTGVVLGEELKKHEQLEEKGKEDGIKGGGFKGAFVQGLITQTATSAAETTLNGLWSSVETSIKGANKTTYEEMTQTDIEGYITGSQTWTQVYPRLTFEGVEYFNPTTHAKAGKDDKDVDIKVSFIDTDTTTNNQILVFDHTFQNITFSKSPNQKTLDDATTMKVAAIASLTSSFYTKTSVETPGNYTLSGQPSGATISSVTVSTEPTPAEITGNVPYHATVSARVTLGTASKDVPLTLSFTHFNKSDEIKTIEDLFKTLAFTGDKHSFSLVSIPALDTALTNASTFVEMQYSKDDGATWSAYSSTSSIANGDDSSKYKFKLVKKSGADKYIFKFENNSDTESAEIKPSSSNLKEAFDVKALIETLTSTSTAAFEITGTSTAPSISFKGTIPQGLSLEIKNGSGNYVSVVGSTPITTGVYPANGNLLDNSTGNFKDIDLSYQISLANPSNSAMFNSSNSSSSNNGSFTNAQTGTVGKIETGSLTKNINVVTIAPTASGNTGNVVIADGTKPEHTTIKYTVYDAQNHAVTGATNVSGSDITTWTNGAGHNLYDAATGTTKYTIKAILVADSGYSLATPASEVVVTTSSLIKLIDLDQTATTGTVSVRDGSSNNIKGASGVIQNDGTAIPGLEYQYSLDGTKWDKYADFTPGNLWDSTKAQVGDWAHDFIKVKVVITNSASYTLPSGVTDGYVRTLWDSASNTSPKITAVITAPTNFTPSATGNTKGLTLSDGTIPPKTHVEYTVYEGSTIITAAGKTAASVQTWVTSNNLWDKATGSMKYVIKAKLLPDDGFAFATAAPAEKNVDISAVKRLIEVDATSTTGTVTITNGDSNAVKAAITGQGTPVNGLKYEFSSDGSTWSEFSSFNPGNIWNENVANGGAWASTSIKVRVSVTSTSDYVLPSATTNGFERELWTSSNAAPGPVFQKVISLPATFAPSATGNTKDVTITDSITVPHLNVKYTVYENGTKVTDSAAVNVDASGIKTWSTNHNLYDASAGTMKYTVKGIIVAENDFKLATAATEVEVANIATITKLIDLDQTVTTDTVKVAAGSSNNIKAVITPGTQKTGLTYKFSTDGTSWYDFASFNPGNIWDQTANDWKYPSLKVKVVSLPGYSFPSNATEAFAIDFWKKTDTTPAIKKFVDTASLITEAAGIKATGNDDKDIHWAIPTNIATDAAKFNLDVKYAFTNQATKPAAGASEWKDFSGLSNAKEFLPVNTPNADKHVWISFIPKDATYEVDATNSTFEITTSSEIRKIAKQVNTSAVDFAHQITYPSDATSKTLTFTVTANSAAADTTQHYKVVYSTTDNGPWQSYSDFARDHLTNINLYDSASGNWSPVGIWARLEPESADYTVSSDKKTQIWSGANTKKIVEQTQMPAGFAVAGTTTKNMTITSPAEIPNTDFEYEALNGTTSLIKGTKAQVEAYISQHNLWDHTNGTWRCTEIKVKLIAEAGTTDVELSSSTASLVTSVWTSAANPTTIAKYVETQAIGSTVSFTSTDSKTITITEPTLVANAGYTFEYSVDNGVNWKEKTAFIADVAQNNLWAQEKGTAGEWRYSNIKVRLKVASGFVLDDPAVSGTSGAKITTLVDFTKSADTDTIAIFVDYKSLTDEITNKLKITAGTDDANLTWNGIADVKAIATKLNLEVKVALTDSTTVSTDPSGVNTLTWIDLDHLATTGKTWSKEGVDSKDKRVWIQITPKTHFTISPNASTAGTKDHVYFNATTSTGVSQLKRSYVVKSTDLDLTATAMSSVSLTINEPTHEQFSFEYYIDNKTTTTYKSVADLNTAIAALDTNHKEGMWDSSTNSWKIKTITVKVVPKSDYVLTGTTTKEVWKDTDEDTFNGTAVTNGMKKYIDTDSSTVNNVFDALKKITPETDSLDDNVKWTTAATEIKKITDRGVKVEFAYSTTDAWSSVKTASLNWTTNISTINKIDEEHAKRFLYARISATNSDGILTQNTTLGNYVDLSTTSTIKSVKTDIDTSDAKYTIDQNLLQGDTHNLTGQTTLKLNASGLLSAYESKAVKIVYSLNEWGTKTGIEAKIGYTGTLKNEMSESDLKGVLNGTLTKGLFDLATGQFATTIQAKIVFDTTTYADAATKFSIKDNKAVTFDLDAALGPNFKKWVNTATGRTAISTSTNANAIKAASTSLHDAVTWNATPITPATIGYQNAVQKFQYFYSDSAIAPAANANGWTDTLPTSVAYDHANRHLWVKFVTTDTTISYSNNDPLDITTSSGIQSIKSKIDSETNFSTWNATKITFTGTTNAVTINPAAAGTLPVGASIKYRVQVYDANASNYFKDSGWIDKAALETLLKSPNRVQIRTIKAHLENSNATQYSLTNDQIGNCDVSGLYSYIDVAAEQAFVGPVSIMTQTSDKIQVWGILGSDLTKSGIQVIIPQKLSAPELAKKGLVLQMSTNGGNFVDFVASATDQAHDDAHAYQQATKGLFAIVAVPDLGAAATHSSLTFRIIPNVQDNLTTPTTVTDKNDWAAISTDIKVKTSEMVASNKPTETSVDLHTLPKLVKTQDTWISSNIKITGTTRDLTITGLEKDDIEKKLTTENSLAGYSTQVEVGFRVSDGKLPANYYLKRADFVNWLAGTLTGSVEVFDTTPSTQIQGVATKTVTLAKPDWNKIDMGTFAAKWFSNDLAYRVSNSTVFTIPTTTTAGATTTYDVKKWTDMTSYLNSLKTMSITGNTLTATSTAFKTVQDLLDRDFGTGKFKIQSTKTLDSNKTNGDWTGTNPFDYTATAQLPELDYLYELALRIIPTGDDFVASTETSKNSTNLDVIWDKKSSANIAKYVHVDVQDLVDHYKLSGDTRNLVGAFDNAKYLKFDKDGKISDTGAYTGIQIYAKVNKANLVGANNLKLDAFMPIADLISALAAAPASIFDGTWGRDAFQVAYRPATGYTIPTTDQVAKTPKAENLTVNRWIDVSAEITSANAIKVTSKNKTEGWWNDAKSDYSDTAIWGDNWGGYVDNEDFSLTAYTLNANHKMKIQYNDKVDQSGKPDSNAWTDTIPTTLVTDSTTRHLFYRFVADGEYTGTGTATNKEIAVLSNTDAQDITTGSKVQKVPTRINIAGVDLSKITFIGNTRTITESLTLAHIPGNAHVEYSITNFINPKSSNATLASDAIVALAKIGVTSTGTTANIFNAYKASMTYNELNTFIELLQPTEKEIIRSSIKARLVPEQGYSITETSEKGLRKNIDVTGLYTLKDITDLTSYLKLATTSGATDGINLYGQKGTTNGILVQIPDDLMTKLAARGLKLQYSITPKELTQAPWTGLSDSPTWLNPNIQDYSVAGSSGVTGAPAVKNGFVITLKSESKTHNEYSYLGFRIVPVQNDEGTPTTIATTGTANADITSYYDDTKTKLYTSIDKFPHKQYTIQAASYDVDTSKLHEVINVTGIDLAKILASGTTKEVAITGDDTAHNAIDNNYPGATTTPKDNLEFLYAIDQEDGSFIDGNKNSKTAVWLTKADMIAYLAGDLKVQGTNVVYKNNTQEKVEAFTSAMITARGFKDGDTYAPKYLDINTIDQHDHNSFFVKWASMDKDYNANAKFIPSVIEPEALSYDKTTFRKWFNGEHFNTQISKLIIKGTTENSSWSVDYTNATDLEDTALKSYGLKMQYSPDGTTWTDQKFDWSTLSWAVRDARIVHMRVVPIATFVETVISPTSGKVEADNISIDYRQSGIGNTANTTTVTNNVRDFKVFLKNEPSELQTIAITGNSFELLSTALDETTVDDNKEEHSKLEIEYLYNGTWYTKTALLAAMKAARDTITDATKAKDFKLPTDFDHSTVKARWHVTDTNNYVLKNEQTGNVSTTQEITKTNFKTFINVWDIQEWASATATKQSWLPALGDQDSLISLATSSGSTLTLNAKIKDLTALSTNVLSAHHLKFQYSIKDTPSSDLSSADWQNGSTTAGEIINGQPWTISKNAPLWIRLVPESTDYVFSNYENNGNDAKVTPIKVDTSKIKYTITTSSAELADIKLSGDTQNGLTTADTRFSVVQDEGNGHFGIKGVTEYVTDAQNNVIANPNQTQADEWFNGKNGVGGKGLRVNYKVTATRSKGTYNAGQEYTFDTLADLKRALDTHNLNFDRSTLQVKWDFSDLTFLPSDTAWVHPTDVNAIVNVVYTNDVYNLNASSFVVTGNDLKTQAPTPHPSQVDAVTTKHANAILTATELDKLGLKIQYNWVADASHRPDGSSWKDTPADGQTDTTRLNSAKDYWVRYAPKDGQYKLATDTGDATQTTKLNVDAIKLSIAFNNADKQAILKEIQDASLTGNTFDFQFESTHKLPEPTPVDKHISYATYGHIQYSIDGTTWSDTIAGALSSTNYYNNGVYQFDKDRGDKLYIRYVFEHTKGNVAPTDSSKYVYTDSDGDEFTLAELTSNISIDNLIQPVFTSATLGQLSNQNSITAQGLTNPSGGADFANVVWKDLANFGLFKPWFAAGNTSQVADFKYMSYDGMIKDANNKYIFNLGNNPFVANDVRTTTDLNALLPRHTHLEYSWQADAQGTPSAWSTTPPTDVVKNSNYAGFHVRLVADAGYALDGTTAGSGFSVTQTYPDGSSNPTPATIPSQSWEHSYNVVVELLTSDIHLKSASQADQAEYVGWNDSTNPGGRFKTDDAQGDHTPSNDSDVLKNILVKLYSGTGAQEKLMDFVNDAKGYVLEWNVTNANNEIDWTDSRGDAGKGWHTAIFNDPDKAPGDTDKRPWYGAYPVSLKNGDVVQVRLRARNGFIISKDVNSTDYEKGKLNAVTGTYELAGTKTSRWSHTISFAPVSGLTTRIDIPANFKLFDKDHPTDFDGKTITPNSSLPEIKFSGNEGAGALAITPNGVHYHYEVAVLKPEIKTGSVALRDSQKPTNAYCLEDAATQAAGTKTIVWTPQGGWEAHYKDKLEKSNAWMLPSQVTSLEVGDGIIVRLVADAGYGFEWEDLTTTWTDTIFPKSHTYDIFGTDADPQTVKDNHLDNADQKALIPNQLVPVPVRGLEVVPRYPVSSLDLVYDNDPSKKLNNGTSVIKLNNYPGMVDPTTGTAVGTEDKYKWVYTVTHANGSVDAIKDYSSTNPFKGLVNGDQVEIYAAPKTYGYVLSPTYNNAHKILTVQGLSDPLDATMVDRPTLQIQGYDGAGTIIGITSTNTTPSWIIYDKTTDAANYAKYPLGRPKNHNNDDLIWEYQVVKTNPFDWSVDHEARETWTTTIPTDLQYGDYVRMRVGTVNPDQVALANNTDWVYSINPTPIKADDGSSTGAGPNADTWFKVEDLWVRSDKLEYEPELSGFIKKTNASIQPKVYTDEVGFVKLQIKITPKNGHATDWLEYNKYDANEALKKLSNDDIVQWRVVTEIGKGFRFNPDEAKVYPVKGRTFAYNQPYISKEKDLKDPSKTIDKTIQVDILEDDSWTFTVSGLKIYIATDNVEYDPDVSAKGFDISSIIVDASGNHAGPVLDAQGNPVLDSKGNPKVNFIVDGAAALSPINITKTDTILDVDGNADTNNGSGQKVALKDIVGVRYIVKQIDPYSGEQQPPFTVDKPGEVPKNLNNQDEITIELYSKDPDFQLSNPKSMTIVIKGLTTSVSDPITDPFLTFSGDSGKGSVTINPQAPLRTKWVYAVTSEPQPGQSLPDIYELKNANDHSKHMIDPDQTWINANPNTYYWTSNPPITLQNGDYVIAMLVSTISGSLIANNITPGRQGEIPMSTEWVRVTGLAQKIDLSRYQFKLIDEKNPWNSNQDNEYDPVTNKYQISNYAFKLSGHQEGETALTINAVLQAASQDPADLSKLLVDQYNHPLPESIASAIQWAFAVNTSPEPNGEYNWSTTLPKTLANGQYVHVKLVAKSSLTNVQVYGYKPQVFKVEGLDETASVTNKVATLVSVVVGGFVALGAAVGTLMFIRKRKKKLHFND